MGALLGLAVGSPAAPPPHPPPPPPMLGPIPTEPVQVEAWVAEWPQWRRVRQRGDAHLQRLREQLRDQGEAEARGQRPPWWDLPSRKRQGRRLRYLQGLRMELERAKAAQFQAQAVEAVWSADLLARQAKGRLPESLKLVLQDLQEQAEKDRKYKD